MIGNNFNKIERTISIDNVDYKIETGYNTIRVYLDNGFSVVRNYNSSGPLGWIEKNGDIVASFMGQLTTGIDGDVIKMDIKCSCGLNYCLHMLMFERAYNAILEWYGFDGDIIINGE